MNPEAATTDRTANVMPSRLERAGQWLPGLVALLATVAVLFMVALGETGQIPVVAWLGGSVFAGGTVASTILTVTVHIRR
ncbi:hypothetical protein ABZ705_10310 [Streptomyces sp. NPDC006984]|uniref:hypothetical protein n=1 Tax=Streptomyces sp. NPDC006984 TaxID=3155463 RepID=UPI003406DA91